MRIWRTRTWITALTAAAAAAVSLWIVYYDDRERLLIIDEAELTEAIFERYAALTYATNLTDLIGWTTLEWHTNAAAATWGGYSNVAINIPAGAGVGNALSGTYHYKGRTAKAGYAGTTADRGFADLYTNGIYTLIDLGPSGGSLNEHRIGGWAIIPGNFWQPALALPRGFGLASSWFMEQDRALPDVDLIARGYNPADCTATPGIVDPARRTWWNPGAWHTLTNHAASLPLRRPRWFSGAGAYTDWITEDYTTPLIIYPPASPFLYASPLSDYRLDAFIAYTLAATGSRPYVDFARTTDNLTDFDGWKTATLPGITNNTDYLNHCAAWTNWTGGATNAILTRDGLRGLGLALMDLQSLHVEGLWTNINSAIYYTRPYSNTPAGWAKMLAAPGWTQDPSRPLLPYPRPAYELGVYSVGADTDFVLFWRVTSADPVGMLGIGHNTNLWTEATAHYWSTSNAIPVGETIVQPVTNQMVALVRETGMTGPRHTFSITVPSFTGPPPTSFFPSYDTFTNGWRRSGYHLDNPVVVGAPGWSVPRYE